MNQRRRGFRQKQLLQNADQKCSLLGAAGDVVVVVFGRSLKMATLTVGKTRGRLLLRQLCKMCARMTPHTVLIVAGISGRSMVDAVMEVVVVVVVVLVLVDDDVTV